ncbi:MAG: HEPN domain-containing protein [Nitrospirae bacterium]|nr:MAG: HEPN domain-containing protein [Nitrospirota bacterium]
MNPEATELWGRALQAFQTAQQIADTDPDAAAGRVYYAAFYAVSAFFALQGKTFSRHSAVEIAVNRDLVKAGHWTTELGKTYTFLLELRATGDYGGALHVSHEDIGRALTGSRRILDAIRQSSPEQFPFPAGLG